MASTKSSGSCSCLANRLLDLVGLVVAQQAVVHEDAGQPVADGPVDQHRGDGRIDAARQAADDLAGLPTCCRIRAVASSMNDAIVQSPVQPQTSKANAAGSSAPCSVCTTSGWNSRPYSARSGASIAAIGAVALVAASRKPGRHRRRRRRRGWPTRGRRPAARRRAAAPAPRRAPGRARGRTRGGPSAARCRRACRSCSCMP